MSAALLAAVALLVASATAWAAFVTEGGPYPTGDDPLLMYSADFNGDGHPDLVALNGSDSSASVYLRQPGGFAQEGAAIPVASVSLPNQLVVADVKFAPPVLRSRAPFTIRVKVTDGRNRPVAGALVYVIGLPYAYLRNAPEVASGNDGYAAIALSPTAALPRNASIVLFVRVRKPGEPLVGAGVSSRRLVQVTARL